MIILLNSEFAKAISIPSGAIKSVVAMRSIVIIFLFQFLLVRLKAFANTNLTAQNFISIPSGAIKRSLLKKITTIK